MLSGRLKIKLRNILTEEEIEYIEKGKEAQNPPMIQIGDNNKQHNAGRDSISNAKNSECDDLSDEIVNIIKILKTFDKKQQREVLNVVWDMEG